MRLLKIVLNNNLERILIKQSPGSVSLEACHLGNCRPQVLPLFHFCCFLGWKRNSQCTLSLVFAHIFYSSCLLNKKWSGINSRISLPSCSDYLLDDSSGEGGQIFPNWSKEEECQHMCP